MPPSPVRPASPADPALVEAARRVEEAKAADRAGRHADAVALLRQAAEAGHPDALSFLGARLLVGQAAPFAPAKGLSMLKRAAALDQVDAHRIMATLAAASAADTPDGWRPALDHLQRAAELGSDRARAQLRLLASAGNGSGDAPDVWGRLRQAIDMAAWLRPPHKRVLSEAPRVRAVEGFLTPEVCDWLVDRAKPLLRPATVFDLANGTWRREEARTNSSVQFDIVQSDLVVMLVRARIGQAVGLPPAAMELTQVLHYEVGQRFTPHVDYFDPGVAAYEQLTAGGQRIATVLVYLNDGYEGGETAFPRIGLRHRGRKGDALYFANVDADGRPDPLTLHSGEPPTSGVKWLLSQWIRDRVGPPLE